MTEEFIWQGTAQPSLDEQLEEIAASVG